MSATISEIPDEVQVDSASQGPSEAPAPPPTKSDQIRMTLGVLTPWIEKGALQGAFSLDDAHNIFLSLNLLQLEPGTVIQLEKGQTTRALAGKNMLAACSLIQSKGGIFGDLEQTSKIVEIVNLLGNLLQEEEQEQKNVPPAKRIAESDFLPADVQTLKDSEFTDLIAILRDVVQTGQAKGVVPFELVHKVCCSLKLLMDGPRACVSQNGKVVLEPLQAFQFLCETINHVVTRGSVLQLVELVRVRMVIVCLKKIFLRLMREEAATQKAAQQPSDTDNRGKKRSKVDCILNDE